MAQKIMHELSTMKKAGKDVPLMDVYNLEGSIFKWANEGRILVDSEDKKTIYCHPYNMVWGKLLESRLRKYELETEENTAHGASQARKC